MSGMHKSVFGNYERKDDVQLDFSEENPEKTWEFGDELGRGAFAVIKKCSRKSDKEKLYAAKFVKYDDEALKILKREVSMIQKWKHEKFIYLYEVYIVRKYVVLVMEWVDGKNLLPYLIGKQEEAEKNKRKAKLSEKDIAILIKQLLTALQYLHQLNIAYLDIKPDNIMVQANAEIKLVDYDNCRHIVSKQGDVVDCIGTLEFTAPEALVYENCSFATDVWPIGVLIYVMLTGHSPFADPDEEEVKRKVAKVQFDINKDQFGRASEHGIDIIKGVFKRIPEKRYSLDTILAHDWFKKDVLWSLGRNVILPSADDFKKLQDALQELESEEPVVASCVLRSFPEEEYQSPEESSEEEDDEE